MPKAVAKKPKGIKTPADNTTLQLIVLGTLIVAIAAAIPAAIWGWPFTSPSKTTATPPKAQATKARAPQIFAQAFSLYQKEDMQGAAELFTEYLRIEPRDTSALNNLGLCQTALMQLDQSIETFQRVLRIKPTHADAYSNLGMALGLARRPTESVRAYRDALLIDPSHANAARNLELLTKPSDDGSHERLSIPGDVDSDGQAPEPHEVG